MISRGHALRSLVRFGKSNAQTLIAWIENFLEQIRLHLPYRSHLDAINSVRVIATAGL